MSRTLQLWAETPIICNATNRGQCSDWRISTVTETRKAIQHLSTGKPPGADAIPADVYKASGVPMTETLTELFQCMLRKEAVP